MLSEFCSVCRFCYIKGVNYVFSSCEKIKKETKTGLFKALLMVAFIIFVLSDLLCVCVEANDDDDDDEQEERFFVYKYFTFTSLLTKVLAIYLYVCMCVCVFNTYQEIFYR